MTLYIVGPVGSGKTTLAKQLSYKTKVPFYSLDQIVHEPDASSPWGNRKRPETEQTQLFQQILTCQDWIVEDTGRPCFEEGFRQADRILLLELPTKLRCRRILVRWMKQKCKLEPCFYKPSVQMLKCMLGWNRDYDLGVDGLKQRLLPYRDKVTELYQESEVEKYLENFTGGLRLRGREQKKNSEEQPEAEEQ